MSRRSVQDWENQKARAIEIYRRALPSARKLARIRPGDSEARMVEAGIYSKNGLDVSIKKIPQASRHLAIASGDVQCAATTVETWIVWNANGVATTQLFQMDKSYGADGMVVRNPIASIKDIKAVGKSTVIFTLDGGNADFPYLTSDYHIPIMPAKGPVVSRP